LEALPSQDIIVLSKYLQITAASDKQTLVLCMEKEQSKWHEDHSKLLIAELAEIPKKFFYEKYGKKDAVITKRLTGNNYFVDIWLPFEQFKSACAVGFSKNMMWMPVMAFRGDFTLVAAGGCR